MENVYSEPKSNLSSNEILQFTFSNLGIWRKIYIILNWIFSLAIPLVFILPIVLVANENNEMGMGGISIWQFAILFLILLISLAYAFWLHLAIIKRNVTQLLIIIILNIVLFLNPVSAIFIYAIRRTSKKELEGLST